MRTRELRGELRGPGFRAYLDYRALYIADTTAGGAICSDSSRRRSSSRSSTPASMTIRRCPIQGRIRHPYDPGTMSDLQLRLGFEVPGKSQNIGVATPVYHVSPAEA